MKIWKELFNFDLSFEFFYFVHSYYAETDEKNVVATTDYGISFPSIINFENLYGVQFHPEKSQNDGKQILSNFSKI